MYEYEYYYIIPVNPVFLPPDKEEQNTDTTGNFSINRIEAYLPLFLLIFLIIVAYKIVNS